MFSKEAIKLAKATAEAIKKIAERQEKKCSRCNGLGTIYSFGKEVSACFICYGTGKVKGKWEWEPRRGEFVLRQAEGEVDLITRTLGHGMLRLSPEADLLFFDKHTSSFTPLLHWENDIEPTLEGMGWSISLTKTTDNQWHATLLNGHENSLVIHAYGKSRQLAVMRAVVELGKEK